ncbi:hypothetical protein EJ06DRAFT_212878 [Trichodelitschia bisporula]|uniref:Uncharacterized protein n=1 Tax=Trichodelitschia bisporula TaxID=703511 RepID=A0A6G1I924_9PEZI|nr:hypothetical protein EJ06DRAFT_212878 [Trichodelitschia bisporula]
MSVVSGMDAQGNQCRSPRFHASLSIGRGGYQGTASLPARDELENATTRATAPSLGKRSPQSLSIGGADLAELDERTPNDMLLRGNAGYLLAHIWDPVDVSQASYPDSIDETWAGGLRGTARAQSNNVGGGGVDLGPLPLGRFLRDDGPWGCSVAFKK